jgi:hypothetical protein
MVQLFFFGNDLFGRLECNGVELVSIVVQYALSHTSFFFFFFIYFQTQ